VSKSLFSILLGCCPVILATQEAEFRNMWFKGSPSKRGPISTPQKRAGGVIKAVRVPACHALVLLWGRKRVELLAHIIILSLFLTY
jgi:hypothetical protein